MAAVFHADIAAIAFASFAEQRNQIDSHRRNDRSLSARRRFALVDCFGKKHQSDVDRLRFVFKKLMHKSVRALHFTEESFPENLSDRKQDYHWSILRSELFKGLRLKGYGKFKVIFDRMVLDDWLVPMIAFSATDHGRPKSAPLSAR